MPIFNQSHSHTPGEPDFLDLALLAAAFDFVPFFMASDFSEAADADDVEVEAKAAQLAVVAVGDGAGIGHRRRAEGRGRGRDRGSDHRDSK